MEMDRPENVRTDVESWEVGADRHREYAATSGIQWWLVGLTLVLSIVTLLVLNYPALETPMIYDSVGFIWAKSHVFQRNNVWDVISITPVRPLFMVSLYLNYITTGMDPFYFRLTNIVLAAAAGMSLSLLVFLVLYIGVPDIQCSQSQKFGVSLFLGFVFVVHPLQTLVTLYIWQREAILACLFYFSTVAAYVAARSGYCRSPTIGFGLTGVLFLAGLLCKENVVTVPAILLLAEATLFRGNLKDLGRSVLRIGALVLLPLLLYFAVTNYLAGPESRELHHVVKRLTGYYEYAGLSLAEVLLTESRVFFIYLTTILLPIPGTVTLIKAMNISGSLLSPPITVAACTGVAGLVGFGIYLIRRRPVTAFGILFFVISLIPESTLIPYYLFFGYRAILPMAGVFMILGEVMLRVLAARRAESGIAPSNIALGVFSGLALAGLLTVTHLQAVSWNPLTFWIQAYEGLPTERASMEKKPYLDVLHNLTVLLIRRGDFLAAEGLCREVVALYPDESLGALTELGNILLATKRIPEAIEAYRKAVELKPKMVQPYVNLGAAYVGSGQHENAREVLQKAVSLDPRHAKAHVNLGIVLVHLGLFPEAMEHLNKAVQIDPGLAIAHLQLGIARDRSGDVFGAVKSYERALHLVPTLVNARIQLAKALAKLQRYPESIDHYQQILLADPKNYRIHNDLAYVYITTSQFEKAVGHCRKALSLKPDFSEAETNLKLALERAGTEAGKTVDRQ